MHACCSCNLNNKAWKSKNVERIYIFCVQHFSWLTEKKEISTCEFFKVTRDHSVHTTYSTFSFSFLYLYTQMRSIFAKMCRKGNFVYLLKSQMELQKKIRFYFTSVAWKIEIKKILRRLQKIIFVKYCFVMSSSSLFALNDIFIMMRCKCNDSLNWSYMLGQNFYYLQAIEGKYYCL
jgi:hypothetical protein